MHITVPVNPPFQQYFTCYWKGCYYEFLRIPNGYAQTPLLFTKLLKQPFGFLQKHGYASVIYIDDSYLQGDTYVHCLENIHAACNLLVSLGFSINQDKSVLQPAQRIVFLGFVLDSLHMSICLSDKCKGVILDICKKLNSGASHKIRAVQGGGTLKWGHRHLQLVPNVPTDFQHKIQGHHPFFPVFRNLQ